MMKILLVDDEEIIHLSYKDNLLDLGFEVMDAYDGEEALRIARDYMPDLIVLDVMMPGMDGRDVCKNLKNSPETKHIKVIMLTSRDADHDRTLGFELGADEYLAKPYPSNLLEIAIRKQLGMEPYANPA